MADRKISDLTALTTPASGDFLPIVDISEAAAASKNKRITIEELFRGVPLGTAAAPSIAIEGDEDTGVFSPGANQLAVATNGTGRLFIDASGAVGIGTTSVDARLLVSDGTNINTRIGQLSLDNFAGEGAGIRFSRTTSDDSLCALGALNAVDGDLGLFSRNNLIFATGGASNYSATTERARIDSSGRLLVGASADSGGALLQVNGDRIRVATAKTPASAADTGTAGEICWDADYIYVCTATNTWKRSAIATW
jgi:hypothetical protein